MMEREERASVLLGNKRGGFAWLAPHAESRYQGVFFTLGETLFKTVAHLDVHEPVRAVTDMLWGAQREYFTVNQRLTMPHGANALLVEFSAPARADLLLDCKIIDDNREWGRLYEVSHAQDCVVVSFRKRNDKRDDNSRTNKEFQLFLAIAGDAMEFFPVNDWVEQRYAYDESRKSAPWSRWVFNAGTVNAQRFVIAAGLTKKAVIAEAKRVLKNRMSLVHKQMDFVAAAIAHKKIPNKRFDLAYACACRALGELSIDDKELAAGYPWFYQCWTRDALVSSKALALINNQKLAKKLILQSAAQKQLATRPGSQLLAADAPGWLGVRAMECADLFNLIEKRKLLKELKRHRAQLKLEHGLVVNKPHETWMDSIAREGARIEVQALSLALARALGETEFEQELARRVREVFWNGSFLHDGLNDATIRPNAFIAAYAYPDLLSRDEWEQCFDALLPKLWLPWGGIATIDTSDARFIDGNTGEDPASYHQGDSWFWLNNLAAIVLARVNAEKYARHIHAILEASSHEILALGAIGHHAELSSARALSSHGCVSQAWSAALFIELCHELFSASP
jgi:hypothetical protein